MARDNIGMALAEDANRAANLEGIRTREAGANYRAGLDAAARVEAARTAIAPEMNKQEGLGDIGATYKGGKLDLQAIARKSPVVPAGIGPETGKWQDLRGGLQASYGGEIDATGRPIGDSEHGTFTWNRPAHREVVGAEGGPVHVLRSTRSTYAGGAPGEEWGSLQRAAQAINRAAGEGEYAPPGASLQNLVHKHKLEEIGATGKAMEAQGGLAAKSLQGATDYLKDMLLQGHGIADPTDKTGQTKTLPGYAREAMLKMLPEVKTIEDVPKLLERMGPELERGKQMDLFNNPATRESARKKVLNRYREDMAAVGRSADANMESVILKSDVTPDNLTFFSQAYNRGVVPTQKGTVAPQERSMQDIVPQELQSHRALVSPPKSSVSLLDLTKPRRATYSDLFGASAM